MIFGDRLKVDGVGRMGEEVKVRCKIGRIRGDFGEEFIFRILRCCIIFSSCRVVSFGVGGCLLILDFFSDSLLVCLKL